MKGGEWAYYCKLKKQHTALMKILEEALDSLEYIERCHPNLSGYGVRQSCIRKLRRILEEVS